MIMRPIGLSIVMVDQREFTRENTMVCAPYWTRKTCTYTVGEEHVILTDAKIVL